MKHRSRYPKDWEAIALKVKQQAHWKCKICGLDCIPTGLAVAIAKSERARYRLEAHHINGKPEDSYPENLIALCSACHLRQHRHGHGSVPVGQMSLFS